MKYLFIVLFISLSFCMANDTKQKGMWQRFVDFFTPSKSVNGNSAIEQDILNLDKKIQETKANYNREHRPQRKSMLKKELNDLSKTRDSLMTVLQNNSPVNTNDSVKHKVQEPLQKEPKTELSDTVWVIEKRVVHDTIFVHDTVYTCDTILQAP